MDTFLVEFLGFSWANGWTWQTITHLSGRDAAEIAARKKNGDTGFESRVINRETGRVVLWLDAEPRNAAERDAADCATLDAEATY